MGAEATVADLAPGYGGQMGPSGPTIYPSTRFFFGFLFVFFSQTKARLLTQKTSLGRFNKSKVTHAGKTPNGVTNLQPGGHGPLRGRECT